MRWSCWPFRWHFVIIFPLNKGKVVLSRCPLRQQIISCSRNQGALTRCLILHNVGDHLSAGSTPALSHNYTDAKTASQAGLDSSDGFTSALPALASNVPGVVGGLSKGGAPMAKTIETASARVFHTRREQVHPFGWGLASAASESYSWSFCSPSLPDSKTIYR